MKTDLNEKNCFGYLLLCNKLPPNLVILNYHHFIAFHDFVCQEYA